MKIYIDHFPEQDDFVEKLINGIKNIDEAAEVSALLLHRNEQDSFEGETEINLMNKADIIIPIITPRYIAENWPSVERKLNEIVDSDEKYLLPIIYSDANYSSKKWLVKSSVFPQEGSPFLGLNERDKAKTWTKLMQTIESILSHSKEKSKGVNISTKKKPNKNMVFISHDHQDADFAELLKLKLEKENIIGWIDTERLKVGQDWREEIDEGIKSSIALVVIMSQEARKSEYVTYEWAFAWGKGIKIFPIMLKQTPMHPRLESLQYLDFTNRLARPWSQLINSIKILKMKN